MKCAGFSGVERLYIRIFLVYHEEHEGHEEKIILKKSWVFCFYLRALRVLRGDDLQYLYSVQAFLPTIKPVFRASFRSTKTIPDCSIQSVISNWVYVSPEAVLTSIFRAKNAPNAARPSASKKDVYYATSAASINAAEKSP